MALRRQTLSREPCQSCFSLPTPSLHLVTSPPAPGFLSQLLPWLAREADLCRAQLWGWRKLQSASQPSLYPPRSPRAFSLPLPLPEVLLVTQASLAVALLGIARPLAMLRLGPVRVRMSLKPYSFSGFGTATFVSIPCSSLHISCIYNRQFSCCLFQCLINCCVLCGVLLVMLLRGSCVSLALSAAQ